jgi:hypothetical protein
MNFRNARLVAVFFVLATFGAVSASPVRADFGTNSPGGGKQTSEPIAPETSEPPAEDGGIGGLFADLFALLGIDL